MAGILAGLKELGLGDLEDAHIFEEEEKEIVVPEKIKKVTTVAEKDLIYDKSFVCPVCDNKFTSKVMRTGKTKLVSVDIDLRMKYEGIDVMKYEVHVCPKCGYAAMGHFYHPLINAQIRMVKENIVGKVHVNIPTGEVYTYEEVIERYQLALACAIVKHAKDSEKAYICLHYAWLLRGYAERLKTEGELTEEKEKELKSQEQECLNNAYEGFVNARQKEALPICGMDQVTTDYLVAVLAYQTDNDSVAAKMISEILVSSTANARMKDKAREIKYLLLEKHKK